MTEDARMLLDTIDEFLMRDDVSSREVAAVLTAIRSDDNADNLYLEVTERIKRVTTVPIRVAAFPKLAARGAYGTKVTSRRNLGMDLGDNYAKEVHLRTGDEGHFAEHTEAAAVALGLTVVRKHRD